MWPLVGVAAVATALTLTPGSGEAECLLGGGGGTPSSSSSGPRDIRESYNIKAKPIGTGAFGMVYMGSHRLTGEAVAIKRLPKSSVQRAKVLEEVRIMRAAGEHRGIIPCKDFFEDNENFYVVMEVAEGGELFNRLIEQGMFSEQQASVIMGRATEAILFLHHQGIVHGDLKPENLLLSSQNTDETDVRLVDFGTAFRGDQGRLVVKEMHGTVAYDAPEVVRNQPCGFKADVWALGVIMYILLAGFHPFDPDYDADDDEMRRRIATESDKYVHFEGASWASVSPEAKDLLRRLLDADPDKRPSAQEMLCHPWISQHSALSKEPLETSENLRRLHRGRRRLRALLLAVLTGVAGQDLKPTSLGSREAALAVLDQGKKGHISKQDLSRALSMLGEDPLDTELTEMLRSGDGDPMTEAEVLPNPQVKRLVPPLYPTKVLREGDVLYFEGEVDPYFYIMKKGEAAVRTSDTAETLVEVLRPGDTFGEVEMLILSDDTALPRATSVSCTSKRCEVIVVEDYLFSLLADVFESTNSHLRHQAERRCRRIVDAWAEEVTSGSVRKLGTGEVAFLDRHDRHRLFVVKEGYMQAEIEVEVAPPAKKGARRRYETVFKRFGPGTYLCTNGNAPNECVRRIECQSDAVVVEVPLPMYEDFVGGATREALMRFLMETQEARGDVVVLDKGSVVASRGPIRRWLGHWLDEMRSTHPPEHTHAHTHVHSLN